MFGGSNVKEVVRNILGRTIEIEFAKKVNFSGTHDKTKYQDSALHVALIGNFLFSLWCIVKSIAH
jgi:hypothetical protein